MNDNLKKSLARRVCDSVDAVGFAPVERFAAAPNGHHPAAICRNAGTVIVYGTAVPRGAIASPNYALHLLQRSYHTAYPHLDQVGLLLANFLENEGHLAVVIPSYAPLIFHGLEPWGILSLKHAAALAGLGSFGRSGLLYHPRFGALLRLGAVITDASLPGDPLIEEEPCPPHCDACRDSCPAGAFRDEAFHKMACLGYSIKHGVYRHVLSDDYGRENLEMVINTTGYNYWIDCDACLRACPLNGMNRLQGGA